VLLTAEDDELTATMKLKRSFVEQKHKRLIDEMYG
jgi:long-chain acyl-CoA synthetase